MLILKIPLGTMTLQIRSITTIEKNLKHQKVTMGDWIVTVGDWIVTVGDWIVTVGERIVTVGDQIVTVGDWIKQHVHKSITKATVKRMWK